MNHKNKNMHLNYYIRSYLTFWKIESLNRHKYKCVITGKEDKNNIIHHLYSFNKILQETLEILDFPFHEKVWKYRKFELNLIVAQCQSLHYKYGWGICISKEIHELFHKMYGKYNNTPEQFEKFTLRYKSGEFNDYIKSNPIPLPTTI